MNRAKFDRLFPGAFFLSSDCPDELGQYLMGRSLINSPEDVQSVTIAGAGNMNCVLRVVTEQRSLIVKQSRPWVEKYPNIAAPRDRVLDEARFYADVADSDFVASRMPQLIDCDPDAIVMVLQDLGESRDFTFLYRSAELLATRVVTELFEWLTALHRVELKTDRLVSTPNCRPFSNLEMRRLNHEHIFRFPLDPGNGLHLGKITAGLDEHAQTLRHDVAFVDAVTLLGDVYLDTTGDCLLHGDFFPGSWLRTSAGVRIIDPEFSFRGPPEFDVGVFLAHLHLTGHGPKLRSIARNVYQPAGTFDWKLADQFAGVEIMRRLIGVAQLPLVADLETKKDLLELSRELVLAGHP